MTARLIEQMREERIRRNYAETTIYSYIRAIRHIANHIAKPLDQLGPDDLRSYHAHLPLPCWRLQRIRSGSELRLGLPASCIPWDRIFLFIPMFIALCQAAVSHLTEGSGLRGGAHSSCRSRV